MHLMILENHRLRHTLRPAGDRVMIGSDSGCDIHLPDPRLGKHQASLIQDGEGEWWLEVIDCAVPTCLNRTIQKNRARLRHADEIEMGPFAVRFFVESEKSREELAHDRMVALTRAHGEMVPIGTIIQKDDVPAPVTREDVEQFTLLALKLNAAESIVDALPPVLRAVLRTFEAKRAWLGIRRHEKGDLDWTLGLSPKGSVDMPPYVNTLKDRSLDFGHALCVPSVPVDGVGSAMIAPIFAGAHVHGLVYLENDAADAAYDEAALSRLRALACCASVPVDTILHKSAAVKRAAATTGLAIARATQDALTVRAMPQWDTLKVAAYRHMGTAVACDFYDVVQLRNKTAALIVAKIHVDPVALPRYFSEVRAAFRAAALYGEAPHLFARMLNWLLFDGNASTYVDIAVATICPQTGKVVYCLAGQRVMMGQVHADGSCEQVAPSPLPPVGQIKAPAYESGELTLEPGDSIAIATDGVNAAVNADGAAFGLENLKENLCDGLGDTPGHALSELATDLNEYLAEGQNPEDITVVLARRD